MRVELLVVSLVNDDILFHQTSKPSNKDQPIFTLAFMNVILRAFVFPGDSTLYLGFTLAQTAAQ